MRKKKTFVYRLSAGGILAECHLCRIPVLSAAGTADCCSGDFRGAV